MAGAKSPSGAPPSMEKFYGEIPQPLLNVSPVASYTAGRTPLDRGFALPLNLLALIVSHLDDLGDLARVTRTSRLLYYMTLPQLYHNVTLRSYPEIRFFNGRPEGFGGGSPVCMALSGLSTGNSAAFVKRFRIAGAWPEAAHGDYAQGRVPDGSMLLNIVMRNAIDKMANVMDFSWELETKPLKTVYQGLAARSSLTSMTIKFSASRTPRPTTIIPPMPNLRHLKLTDIDPLCCPDDVSVLLLHSKSLESLRMHWSPRMRREAEPSTSLYPYFGKCLSAKHHIPLKYVAFQNFYGTNDGHLLDIFDAKTLTSTHFVDVFGGARGGSSNVFIDDTWKNIPDEVNIAFKIHRTNEPSIQHAQRILNKFTGLEEMYFINAHASASSEDDLAKHELATPKTVPSPPTPGQSPGEDVSSLGKEYVHVLTTHHGATLRKLLLSDQWSLNGEQIATLVRSCPHLEQLGLALSGETITILGFLIPFLPKLRALRISSNDWLLKQMEVHTNAMDMYSDIGRQLYQLGCAKLEWLGLAHEVFRVDKAKQFELADGQLEWRRDIVSATREDVQHVEIWGLDNLEI